MKVSPGDIAEASKLSQALDSMKRALNLLDEVECTSTAAAHLDLAISVLERDLGVPANPQAG